MLNLDTSRFPEWNRAKFIAGTFFWIRWSILKELFEKHIRPCTLRKLCNDDTCIDYHWYRLPNTRTTLGANHGKTLVSCEESVRHFESIGAKQNIPGSIIHTSFDKLKVPWDSRFRDGQFEHALERFFGYWVMYTGYETVGV